MPDARRLESIDAAHPDTVALLAGPLVLMRTIEAGAAPCRIRRESLLGAQRDRHGGHEWQISTDAARRGAVKLKPFLDIDGETLQRVPDGSAVLIAEIALRAVSGTPRSGAPRRAQPMPTLRRAREKSPPPTPPLSSKPANMHRVSCPWQFAAPRRGKICAREALPKQVEIHGAMRRCDGAGIAARAASTPRIFKSCTSQTRRGLKRCGGGARALRSARSSTAYRFKTSAMRRSGCRCCRVSVSTGRSILRRRCNDFGSKKAPISPPLEARIWMR